MTNEEKIIKLFIEQYPQYENIKNNLSVNLYADILDTRKAESERVIAISDLQHNLNTLNIYSMPTKWQLKEWFKMLSMEQIGFYNFMQQEEAKQQEKEKQLQEHLKDNVIKNNYLVSECGRTIDLLRKR